MMARELIEESLFIAETISKQNVAASVVWLVITVLNKEVRAMSRKSTHSRRKYPWKVKVKPVRSFRMECEWD
jgi:hypothetical protein